MAGRRVAVLGAGANGAAIGADLTEAGVDVTLIEQWPAHVEAMRADGVTVNLPDAVKRVPVRVLHLCEVAELTERFDVVLMLVKAYDSRWSTQLLEPHLAPDGLLVGVQNGMTVDTVTEVVGPARTLGCVIEISSMMFEPGVIERHSPFGRSWFAVGALTPDMRSRVDVIADLLRVSGTVEVVDDIRAAKWMKLVNNSSTLVPTAILGLPMLEAAAIPEMRQLMEEAGREALAAVRVQDISVQPIFGMEPSVVQGADLIESMLDWLLRGFVLPETKTTVLQDWMKGRRSEVDDINGLVVSVHRRLGGRAPVNEAIVDLAHEIERRHVSPDPSNLPSLLAEARRNGWRP